MSLKIKDILEAKKILDEQAVSIEDGFHRIEFNTKEAKGFAQDLKEAGAIPEDYEGLVLIENGEVYIEDKDLDNG